MSSENQWKYQMQPGVVLTKDDAPETPDPKE